MAIQFARIELVGRAKGGNACCKGSYNARSVVKDLRTNVTYNFKHKGDNVHHEILLPSGVDAKFKNVSVLMNEIEQVETRKNSSLLKDIVIALPDDKELDLQDRVNISHIIIDKMRWLKEGLGVQLDIHKPHDGETNWHAHILLTKRRFAECGTKLGAKARDLDIAVKGGISPFGIKEDQMIHEKVKYVINDYFKALGLDNRVDSIGINTQEHIGPIRMRSVINQVFDRNEERKQAEIEYLINGTGSALIDKVTRNMSVFTKGDLIRAVKCVPDLDTREKLVENALSSRSVVELFRENSTKTGYFTTKQIRQEEQKVLRLSSYVLNGANVLKKTEVTAKLLESALEYGGLTSEQHIALTELVTNKRGLRILRGRAGVGKSHVLHQLAKIAKANGVDVIGLAPTHKAKEALSHSYFDQTDTVKGMLFKLANGRFSLPKGSLLVVDEAGMIGNDDYHELLRVAATRRCNVVLAGDERQLGSVQRGGMFEVFADTYGSSTILDIKRQQSTWGKEVAIAFSKGDVRRGVSILQDENRIKWHDGRIDAMDALVSNWDKSDERVKDRLILAVKNSDVRELNHRARQYLKLDGTLKGIEVKVGENHYMGGDRILLQKTNKDLGVVNGDLGKILEVAKDRFVIEMDVKEREDRSNEYKIIELDPSKWSHFSHGYATTVFKAQGASIKDVYVYHDGFAGVRNSYVAVSRNINELNLYVNNQNTKSTEHLIKQLSYDPEKGSSLNYYSKEESIMHKQNTETLSNISLFDKALLGAYDFVSSHITKLTDKYLPKSEYYNYQEPRQKIEAVSEVIDKIHNQIYEQKLVVGGNISITNHNPRDTNNTYNTSNVLDTAHTLDTSDTAKPSLTPKSKFYANVDYIKNKEKYSLDVKTQLEKSTNILRQEANFKSEQIAIGLLGASNKHLSNKRELRFGESGKIVVCISGHKAGLWYDFAKGAGGDIFDLIQDRRSCSFTEAAEYVRRSLGIQIGTESHNNAHLKLVHDHSNSNLAQKYIQDKSAEDLLKKQKHDSNLKNLENTRDTTHINEYLQTLHIQKQKAKTPDQVMSIIKQEQEFLVSLKDNLKDAEFHKNAHSESLSHLSYLIQTADTNQQQNTFEQLHKLVTTHIANSNIKSDDVIHILKTAPCANEALKDLSTHYQNFVINDLQRCLNEIDKGMIVKLDNKHFDCPINFLEHVLEKHKNNEFLPKDTMTKTLNTLLDRQKDLHLSKEIDL